METLLAALMRCIETVDGPFCASQIAPVVGKPVEVVDGMLGTLAGIGKIAKLDGSSACRWCPLRSGCAGLSAGEQLYYNPAVKAD